MIFDFVEDDRFPEFYKKCRNTGTFFYKKAVSREYTDSYFQEEYKKQYSKTYREDETNLRNLAKKRLSLLAKYAPLEGKLFEIGCASGYFLDEAKKAGFAVSGIEISQSESAFARSIGLDVATVSMFDYAKDDKFSVICAFFVLEHFPDLEQIFARISNLLLPGGLLFLGLPSAAGPVFSTNPTEWFKTHPTDHFYDFTPQAFKKTMQRTGLEVIHASPMSYHRERDKGWKGQLPEFLYRKLADLTCYGDTIHTIAKKINNR